MSVHSRDWLVARLSQEEGVSHTLLVQAAVGVILESLQCLRDVEKGEAAFLFYWFIFIYLFIYWPGCEAFGILVPRPGIEPTSPAVPAWSLSHWTIRKIPGLPF